MGQRKSGRARRVIVYAGSLALALATIGVAAGEGQASAAVAAASNSNGAAWQAAMAAKAQYAGCAHASPGRARCYLKVLRDTAASSAAFKVTKCKVVEKNGYSACNIETAYGLKSISAKDGSGVTVAVVDAYDDPNAESDLAEYRSTYGLPACTTANGCFEKLNQDGDEGDYPSGDMGWGGEISLDLDMVSAICPKCHIMLLEANSDGFSDLLTAEDEAISLGANVVSNSWGTGEFSGENDFDSSLDYPGVPITFSSGDGAYAGGVQYPSASPYVTSVGGTMLVPKKNARGWTEKAWVTKPAAGQEPSQGSGSGCSAYEPKPSWQTDPSCAERMTADVSAVAANVLSYDTYEQGGGGWYFSYGTSVSSPIIAAVYALADNFSSVTNPVSLVYAHSSDLYDITKGSEGTCSVSYFCNAGPGYDGPTGLGSPDGDGAF